MIKALLLMFTPVRVWDDIIRAQRGILFILGSYLLPLLLLSSAVEAYGLVHWGKWQGPVSHLRTFSVREAAIFEAAQFLLSIFIVVVNAGLIKSIGGTFHGRHTFTQTFTTVAYGFGPVFMFRLLNASSSIPPWISWFMGILFTFGVLYHGVPKVIQPDPAYAFGMFLITAMLALFTTGLLELLTACFLQGCFPNLEVAISRLAA
jgi:hypothetical protein